MAKDDTSSTHEFEHLLDRLDKRIPFLAMNPLNEASEKRRFLREKDYVPRFRYRDHRCSCGGLMRKIERIKLEDSIINSLLEEKLEKFRKNMMMNKAIGKDDFSRCSIAIFGEPSKALARLARGFVDQKDCHEDERIGPDEAVRKVKTIISELGLTGWKVFTKRMASGAAVHALKKTIYLKKDAWFSDNFIDRIISHEIGTHVFRTENGRRQPYRLFATGLPNYLMTEEGLAVNCEERNGCLKMSTLRNYAGRTLAVHLALQEGFREVFDDLREHFDDDTAWKLALRAKRGVGDVSRPGAYTKDHVYLEGYSQVKNFLDEDSSKGMKQLYLGKIGLEHLKLLRKIEGLVEPRFLPGKGCFGRL